MSYIKQIIDKLITIQDKFYPYAEEYFKEGEGKVSLVKIVGIDGESVMLKVKGGRIQYASDNDIPIHVFKCSIDTFLDLITGEEDLREAITKGHFVIEHASTGTIDLVELEKWAKAFSKLKNVADRVWRYGYIRSF